MSLRKHLFLPFIASALAFLASCGGNGATPITNPTPPPTGSFSASNLNGTYVFSVSGQDSSSAPYALVGTITANGQGGISAGTIDVNDAASGLAPNSAIKSGSYSVNVDGRGQISLSTSILGTITFDFVLQDSSHGLITEFDNNATGSGTLDLQSAGVTPSGTYAFSFGGAEYFSGTANPFATVGNFTIGAGGTINGTEDFNDSQFAYSGQALSGTLVLGPSSTPGTSFSASFPSTVFAAPLTFDVFAIDATHLKFIEMDSFANLSGDAYAQTTSTIPTGTLAFVLEGAFPNVSSTAAAGGFMVTDGNGNITTASTADYNDGGTVSPSPLGFSGTYTAGGTGRYTLALSGFSEGTSFVAYPFNGGIFLLESDNSGIMVGAAYQQTQNTFAASEGYGLNFTGQNLTNSVEVDDIAEFTANSTGAAVTGVVDENSQPNGGPNVGLALSGTYTTPDTNGRGQVSANAGNSSVSTLNGGFLITYYAVDGTTYPFIETDSNGQVTAGAFVKQNSGASAAVAKPHLFSVTPLPRANSKWRKLK